ncbi:trigger factor [Tepidamorphus gemmatus]|uniref:Trigger factor n=1 Tax=Tepidamorphus gemmatus TaxID=747076 RepID=A0A4R3MG27_9HYPH|nr:trigger factor [Tepidamorphus gemmatus]TCT11289.1 trigger factor [Tepidamorphus gemmatus]
MQVTETLNEGLKRELRITVPAQELDSRLNDRLAELKDRVRIRGFRPGKVPVAHLKRVYGRSVMAEVIEQTVSESSQKAVTDRNERPAFQPEITFPQDKDEIERVLRGEADFGFTMSFEVLPAVEMPDFSKISIEKEVAIVDDALIEEGIARIAAQNRPFAPREAGGRSESGDRLIIDYVGRIDGEPFEGGSDEGGQIELGNGSFIPGFEEQLVGRAAGEQVLVKVTFPETYPARHLAGKEAEFDVTVKEVLAPGEVKIDDEFAKSLGLESLDKLREAVRERLTADFAAQTRRKVKRKLLDALDGATSFELPQKLVESEFESIWRQVTADLERSGRSFADEGMSEEDSRAEYRRIAERRVRLGLLLAEIGAKHDIKVTDEEMNRALIERVQQFPGQERAVWDYYQKNPGALAALRAPVFEEKVVDFILELANVTEKTVTREELFDDPDDWHDHDHHHDHDHDHHHHHHHDHGHDHHHDHDGGEAKG